MASRAEVGLFIFLVTFLGVFAYLVSTMPAEFATASKEYVQHDVPEFWQAVDVVKLNYSDAFRFNSSDYGGVLGAHWVSFKVGGWDVQLRWITGGGGPYHILFRRLEKWWIFIINAEDCKWYHEEKAVHYHPFGDPESYAVRPEDIAQYFDEDGYATFRIECSRFTMTIHMYYNTTKYDSFTDAYYANDWHALIGVTWDQLNTAISAWDLIGRILTFQAPEVHPAINILIAIPIWAATAILVFILIVKVIPFVGGG